MRKFNTFLLHLIILSLFTIILSVIFHYKVEKLDKFWLLYESASDLVCFLPFIAGLSILWPLVFQNKSELQNPLSSATLGFFIVLYIIIAMAGAAALQELAIPKLYEIARHQAVLSAQHLNSKVKLRDTTGSKFSISEFENVKFMPVKNDIAFSMGTSYVYFQKMYNGGGSYYIENFRLIAYTAKKQIDYIVTAEKAKLIDTDLYAVNPIYYEYSGGGMSGTKSIKGTKKIPIVFDADGIYALSSESTAEIASLLDIFRNNDYVYSSKINFFHLGNIVYNKIAYYIVLIFILIISSSFGAAFKNLRQLYRDYFQAACFYVLSAVAVAVIYDTLASVINMIYGLII